MDQKGVHCWLPGQTVSWIAGFESLSRSMETSYGVWNGNGLVSVKRR
jgi:hypothetical protein